jgi:chorismate dehydratase
VGAVSYLNTKPLIYGFEQGLMKETVELTIDYPARVAEMLKNGTIDIGLVPVAVLPKLKKYHIVSDYCIGSDGPVASVCLFSEVPLPEITTILLDYQSRTSVQLLKILLKEYWQINPELLPAYPGYEKDITGSTAGLVIGDRAFEQRLQSGFVYDLGETWKNHTGLPFVFAVWASQNVIEPPFAVAFDAALQSGLQKVDVIAAAQAYTHYDLLVYYQQNIRYVFDEAARQGLALFLEKINAV